LSRAIRFYLIESSATGQEKNESLPKILWQRPIW